MEALSLLVRTLQALPSFSQIAPREVDMYSCADLECPTKVVNGVTEPACRVGSDILVSVGIAPDVVSLPSLSDDDVPSLSLTIGRKNRTATDQERENIFLLGVPKGMNIVDNTQYAACALFFEFYGGTWGYGFAMTEEDDSKAKRASDIKARRSTSCDDILGPNCLEPIEKIARSWNGDVKKTSCMDLAESIQEKLSTMSRTECTFDAVHLSIQGVPVLGPGGPLPLSHNEKDASNCMPMMPSGYQVAKIGWEQHFATHKRTAETDGFTPVMTVVYDRTQDSSHFSLACLRPLDEHYQLEPDLLPGDEESESNLDINNQEEDEDEEKKEDDSNSAKSFGAKFVDIFILLFLLMYVQHYWW